MKLHFTIAYFGQRYHGWQRQEGLLTVQSAVEHAAARVFKEPVEFYASSRTDAGVHAEGQSAHAVVSRVLPVDKIPLAMNSRLPTDIDIRGAVVVPDDFDARRHACWKRYVYRIHNTARRPTADWGRVYHYWRKLDDARMREAAERLVGTHDFGALAHASSQPRASNVRTVFALDLCRVGDTVEFAVEGNGFLYKMVRNTIGVLLEVGRGHKPLDWIDELLAGGQAVRARESPPAVPPQGLTLMLVSYQPHPNAVKSS